MQKYLLNYLPIAVFFVLSLGLSCMMLVIARLRSHSRPDQAKLSSYECGFEPVSDARIKFSLQYYLVAILFIIFDLEIAFLFPWALMLKKIGWTGFFSMMSFITILAVGFIYEWKKGALEWD